MKNDLPNPPMEPRLTGAESAELMYVKCAHCGAWMDVKPGHINSISHSICPSCYEQEMRKIAPESRPAGQ